MADKGSEVTVSTQPLFDDSISIIEFEAKYQMGLDDAWRIKSFSKSSASLSNGYFNVEMICEINSKIEIKTGIVRTLTTTESSHPAITAYP